MNLGRGKGMDTIQQGIGYKPPIQMFLVHQTPLIRSDMQHSTRPSGFLVFFSHYFLTSSVFLENSS